CDQSVDCDWFRSESGPNAVADDKPWARRGARTGCERVGDARGDVAVVAKKGRQDGQRTEAASETRNETNEAAQGLGEAGEDAEDAGIAYGYGGGASVQNVDADAVY